VGATLRPETMYGQTNCFLNPNGDYGLFRMKNDEIFICNENSMKNMMMQDLTIERGKYNCFGILKGSELFGIPLSAPLCVYPTIYTLPMKSISMNKGTGVVIGVPSDSPDDYITLKELQDKQEMRSTYGLLEIHVSFPLVEIINIPEIGSRAGETICEKLKIKSPNDTSLLKQAKNAVYQSGFYKGVLMVGDYVGKKVFEAKSLVRNDLIKSNHALPYWEPESVVVSRSGDECVVAQIDQWYLKYGEEDWKNAVEVWIKSPAFNTFSSIVQESFEQTLAWLREWACTRSFGLGTSMPWDPQFVIESLSDSTIYMAYYTFAHLLHPTSFDGSIIGPLGLTPDQMTDEAWDYVLLDKPYISGAPQDSLDQMKNEFNYWYPVDLRVSGKDLITNHLTMSLYNHSAIWANRPDRMPQAFYCNGHVMVDDEKMSKSKGNFIVLHDAIEKWSSDAVRFSLAMSGDIIDDANFRRAHAEEAMNHIMEEDTFIKENTMYEELREGELTYGDNVFNEKMSKYIIEIEKSYSKMRFRDVIMSNGFFEMRNARNYYKDMCKKQGILMHRQVVNRFMESLITILSPICPHYCEYAWTKLLKKDIEMSWPTVTEVNTSLLEKDSYMNIKIHEFRKKVGKNKNATIIVTNQWPDWQKIPLMKLASYWNHSFPNDIKSTMIDFVKSTSVLKPYITKLMSIITNTIEYQTQNNKELISILQLKVDFDECQFWKDNIEYVRKSLELENINVLKLVDIDNSTIDCNSIAPMQPIIIF
jgi:leucyl-tRNA synthetase